MIQSHSPFAVPQSEQCISQNPCRYRWPVTYGSPQITLKASFDRRPLVTPGTAVHWSDDLGTSSTFYHYVATGGNAGPAFALMTGTTSSFGGSIDQTMGFENSYDCAGEYPCSWMEHHRDFRHGITALGSSLTLEDFVPFLPTGQI